jgi:deazaflavin-dependent oxidoreductase (nitroreductase family)
MSRDPEDFVWVREQVAEFEESGGTRANTLWDTGYPIVVITSWGARSGQPRKNPVMRVERDGEYIAVASLGGAPYHPYWYYNFLANPVVQLQDGPVRKDYRARLLEGDERSEAWDYAVATWPTYAEYQELTDRVLPVFHLQPEGGPEID